MFENQNFKLVTAQGEYYHLLARMYTILIREIPEIVPFAGHLKIPSL